MYVDEAGIDNRDNYSYGYCKIGQRFYALKEGKRTQRVSWIAALRQGKLFAPITFEGACNRDLFETWLEESLLPQLHRGDVIIIDNASFHHSQTIDEIVAQAGCEIWYLPPYSPDLNQIEHWWFVRSELDAATLLMNSIATRDCVDAAFKHCPNVFS